MNTIMKTSTSFVRERGVPFAITEGRDKHAALEAAGLNYTVDAVPLDRLGVKGQYADKFVAAVRSSDGAVLGVNSSRFMHFQPSMLGDFAEAVIKIRPDAHISLGGTSLDDRTQFLGVCLDAEPVRAPGGDGRYRHILMYNGTNGNRIFGGHAVTQEMRCMNMFRALLKGGSQIFRLGHNWSSRQLIPTAIKAIQDAVRLYDEMDIEIERLLDIKVADPMPMFHTIAGERPDKDGRALTEWDRRFDALVAEYNAEYNSNIRGTAWGVVMAAEGADEHHSRVRGSRDSQRIGRMLTGTYPLTSRALALI